MGQRQISTTTTIRNQTTTEKNHQHLKLSPPSLNLKPTSTRIFIQVHQPQVKSPPPAPSEIPSTTWENHHQLKPTSTTLYLNSISTCVIQRNLHHNYHPKSTPPPSETHLHHPSSESPNQ
ncbi:unnamed protein product [Ilex paraguariensis]|uniref:Uncharacterized protein n=1 Tax=Ilex paraguariensis TaxID=185542 RepID=A0ABC8SZ73_9AQUA